MTYWKARKQNTSSRRRPQDNFGKGQSREVRERREQLELESRKLVTLEEEDRNISQLWRD